MFNLMDRLRPAALALFALLAATFYAPARAQSPRELRDYSDSDATARSRRIAPPDSNPTEILRSARTVYVAPNEHINAEYLEYKLDKLPEFDEWRLSLVKERERADLVIEIKRAALNYIFSVVDARTSAIALKGKVVAINGLVAAEDISHEIVRRMREKRALPER